MDGSTPYDYNGGMGDEIFSSAGLGARTAKVARAARALQRRRVRNLRKLRVSIPSGLGASDLDGIAELEGSLETQELEGYDRLDDLADDLFSLDGVDLGRMSDLSIEGMIDFINPELSGDLEALCDGGIGALGKKRKKRRAPGRQGGPPVPAARNAPRAAARPASPFLRMAKSAKPKPPPGPAAPSYDPGPIASSDGGSSYNSDSPGADSSYDAPADAPVDAPADPPPMPSEVPEGQRVIETPDGPITSDGEAVDSGMMMEGHYYDVDGLGFKFGKFLQKLGPLKSIVGMIPGVGGIASTLLDAVSSKTGKQVKVQQVQIPNVGKLMVDPMQNVVAHYGPDNRPIPVKPMAVDQYVKQAQARSGMGTGMKVAIFGGIGAAVLIGVVAVAVSAKRK